MSARASSLASVAAEDMDAVMGKLRGREFARLDGAVYLDHAGATLHSELQLAEALAQLNCQLLGNPHSQNDSSVRASEGVDRAREAVLRHFNVGAATHEVVFTANASAALKLVGECFPWDAGRSQFAYTVQNHNSVLGIREYAHQRGAAFAALDYAALQQELSTAAQAVAEAAALADAGTTATASAAAADEAEEGESWSLFAFPGECNFSGQKLDLRLVQHFQQQRGRWQASSAGRPQVSTGPGEQERAGEVAVDGSGGGGGGGGGGGVGGGGTTRWCVLLDAAKLAATSPLDLSTCLADFTCVSFYKMFGYPTGLGALIVRRERSALLQRCYFGGGTVGAAIADVRFHVPRSDLAGRLEDGTVSFLAIAALPSGFKQLQRFGMDNISQHTHNLAQFVHDQVRAAAPPPPPTSLLCSNAAITSAPPPPATASILSGTFGAGCSPVHCDAAMPAVCTAAHRRGRGGGVCRAHLRLRRRSDRAWLGAQFQPPAAELGRSRRRLRGVP
jgi:molybdenum cofactor sulfurtransferase